MTQYKQGLNIEWNKLSDLLEHQNQLVQLHGNQKQLSFCILAYHQRYRAVTSLWLYLRKNKRTSAWKHVKVVTIVRCYKCYNNPDQKRALQIAGLVGSSHIVCSGGERRQIAAVSHLGESAPSAGRIQQLCYTMNDLKMACSAVSLMPCARITLNT